MENVVIDWVLTGVVSLFICVFMFGFCLLIFFRINNVVKNLLSIEEKLKRIEEKIDVLSADSVASLQETTAILGTSFESFELLKKVKADLEYLSADVEIE